MIVRKSIVARALKAAKAAAFGNGEFVGFCLACSLKIVGVDPDAHGDPCPNCHAKKVYGAEEIVMMGAV